MKKIILSTLAVTTIFCANVNALTIQKAVDLAIVNNNLLKEKTYKIKENDEKLIGAKSSYKPTVNVNYSYDTKNNPILTQTKHDSTFNATLSYNLFRGFADKYNIESAQSDFLSSKYNYIASKQDVILKVKQNYINYLNYRKNTLVQQKSVELFQKQYDDSKNFYEQGVRVALNNLLEVEIELLRSKQLLLKSKSGQKIAKEQLLNTIGIVVNEDLDEVELIENENILDTFDKLNLQNRSEIKALNAYRNSLLNKEKSLKGSYYPKVDASIQHKRYGDDFNLNEKDGTYDAQNIGGVTLSWNLYNGGKDKSSIVALKHQVSQVNFQLEDLKLNIDLQYTNAKEQYILANENLKISKKAFEQSKVNYDIVDNRFKEGVSTSKDLIDANYLLTQAQVNYYSAYYDKILAKASLERVFER